MFLRLQKERITKSQRILSLCVIFTLLHGCSSVPLASKEEDSLAKQFQPPIHKSYIYVMRKGRFVGNASKIAIVLNNKRVGHIKNYQYAVLIVDPGKNTVIVGMQYRNRSILYPATIELDAIPGRVYFLATKMVMGAEIPLKLLPLDEGKARLKKYYSRVELLPPEEQIEQSFVYCGFASCAELE